MAKNTSVMKKLLLLICFFGLAGSTYAQEPELLETDWFIDYFILENVTYNNPIVNAIGIVDPNMGFTEDAAWAAMDPESDSFFTDVIYDPIDPAFTFENMGITLPGCHAWCEFASKYFDFLVGDFFEVNFTYEIITNSDSSLTLIMTRDDGDFAVFQDSKILGIDDKALSQVRLYPNPTSGVLFIDSELDVLKQLVVYDGSGRSVLSITPEANSLDVSQLATGLYFLEISTENGRAVKRFIKE
jgi:hypothetical protein